MNDHSSTPAVRVRMAPSPTGFFHIGNARTALFNYLFARHHGGAFILRIEDTDLQRSNAEYEEIIYNALAWLGLNFDESPQCGGDFGPYRQSERFDLYREYSQRLIEKNLAYPAYETPEELAAMKAEQAAQKKPPRYNNAHRELSTAQRETFEKEGRKHVVRLRVPDGKTAWRDGVYGDVNWKNEELDDFVILKSDGSPTYNFACAIDDALMKISHVIRGEDGLSNTPRQILIYNALEFPVPTFAHLPFLLGRDRSKLSKRHGAVNLLDFDAQGVLPSAMFNYLALLGWNPGEGETQEIFSRDELIQKFSLESVNKSGAIFDNEKLAWMNTQYLKAMPITQFEELARPHLSHIEKELSAAPEYSHRALDMARQRIHNIAGIKDAATYFFSDDFEVDSDAQKKHDTPEAKALLLDLRARFVALPDWTHDNIENAIRSLAEEKGVKPAALIHPSRVAVSGRSVGPSLFELLEVLGRERVLRRLEKFARD